VLAKLATRPVEVSIVAISVGTVHRLRAPAITRAQAGSLATGRWHEIDLVTLVRDVAAALVDC
jgi:hypothetical protein